MKVQQINSDTVKAAIQARYGVHTGYLTAAAKDLGLNYTQLCSVVAGRLTPTKRMLEKLNLVPSMPNLPHGSTDEYIVVQAKHDTAALVRYLEVWPDGRFLKKRGEYLDRALFLGLSQLSEYFKTHPVANADAARFQQEATAPVPEGNPDLEDDDPLNSEDAIDPLA